MALAGCAGVRRLCIRTRGCCPTLRGCDLARASFASQAASARTWGPECWSLYLVTDDPFLDDKLVDKLRGAIDGGVTAIQLRFKQVPTATFFRVGEEVRRLTEAANVPFIVDDRLDVALGVGADGLHIGGEDLPWRVARRLLGPDRLLGCSTYGRAELVQEALHPEVRADVLGSGAIFATPTKPSSLGSGLEHLGPLRSLISREADGRQVTLVAIGGVGLDSAAQCIQHGADGVAVVRALLAHDTPEEVRRAAAALCESIQAARRQGLKSQ